MDDAVDGTTLSVADEARPRPSGWKRLIGIGLAMAGASLAIDLGLQALNDATGVVSPLKPFSFVAGPIVAIIVGRVLGLRGRPHWIRAAAIAFAFYLVGAVAFAVIGYASAPPPAAVNTADAGIGGTDCRMGESRRAFSSDEEVRVGATFDPPIPKGATITIRLTRDNEMLRDYPVVQVADTPWACVFGTASRDPLLPGRYHWEMEYSGSSLPPMGVDFVVTD